MTEETKLKNEIKEYLDKAGWFRFHILQRRYAYKGISDIIAIKHGIVLFIEVKSKTGKQSDEQKEFQKNVLEKGGNYVLARSIDDIKECLK